MKKYLLYLMLLILVPSHAQSLDISGYIWDVEDTEIRLYEIMYNDQLIATYIIPETAHVDNATDTFIFRGLPDGGRWVVTPLKAETWFVPASVIIDDTWGLHKLKKNQGKGKE